MRTAARIDTNHTSVVAGFRQLGCTVISLAALGKGVPDLLVGVCGRNLLVEIKDGSRAPSKRRLTSDQVTFKESWRGSIIYVEDVDEILGIVNAFRRGVGIEPATS